MWGKRSFFVLLSSSRQQVSALCLHIVTCAETEILPQLSQPAAKEQTRIILTKQGLVKTMSWYFLSTWKKRGKCACGWLCVCVLCLTVSAIVEQCFSCVLVFCSYKLANSPENILCLKNVLMSKTDVRRCHFSRHVQKLAYTQTFTGSQTIDKRRCAVLVLHNKSMLTYC